MVTDSLYDNSCSTWAGDSVGDTASQEETVGACGMYDIGLQRNAQKIFIENQKERDHSEEADDIIKTDRREISLEGVIQIFLAHDWEIIFVE